MMKRKIAFVPLAALIATSAPGQDSDRRRPGPPPGESGQGNPLLAALDFNRDGELDQREIDMAVVALRRLDRNGDGRVDAGELKAPPNRPGRGGPGADRPGGPGAPGGDGERPQRRGFTPNFAEIDTDGDGKISRDEAPERMKERFDQIDSSGDGFIDKAEQEALVRMIRERFQRGSQGQRQRRERDADQGQGETEKPKRPPVEE